MEIPELEELVKPYQFYFDFLQPDNPSLRLPWETGTAVPSVVAKAAPTVSVPVEAAGHYWDTPPPRFEFKEKSEIKVGDWTGLEHRGQVRKAATTRKDGDGVCRFSCLQQLVLPDTAAKILEYLKKNPNLFSSEPDSVDKTPTFEFYPFRDGVWKDQELRELLEEMMETRILTYVRQHFYRPFLNPAMANRLLCFGLLQRVLADGTSWTTTGAWTAVSSYVIEPICTQCSCADDGTGWKGSQSLESCAQTCQQEGSWFKHASGTRYDHLPGDNNCDCCTSIANPDGDSGWGINIYQMRDVNAFFYYMRTCTECSCGSSDKYFSAVRSFGDCAAFCAAQKFPRFHYETSADAAGTCACCTFSGTGTEASTGSVYTYADSATVVEANAHGMAPCLLSLLSLISLSLL
eukprot:s3003_g2.t1